MDRLARIFLDVDAGDADGDGCAVSLDADGEVSTGGEGPIVLGDLVPFWKIRIEVVLACENRDRMYETIQGDRGAHCELDGPLVEDGEGARKGEAHRANVAVGRRTKVGGASAEGLGARFQLHVDLESDDHLIARPRAGDGRLDR